ncbi:aconitate hydratase [Mycobacterium sherrisii]|uniref:aconitate hydratase n=1 Tax=Mycobacterium sherrisii TaxID=243061 RepID=UPI000A152990|nr:aconitate hydratase [Mycobacterium sherrisii]MCV7031158.1 aconitate hydratase [Mycobacterium sherrisii]ORW83215.1 aconitate hydratase [Mycobacterium sherrisii]
MASNVTQSLIDSHLVSGNPQPGNEIALRVDQALLQDVLGTLVMLELEAMGIERVQIDRAAQYIDHNLLETDNLNGDEHLFLRSACQRFGIWYSRPGNGISHPVHMQHFGKPGDTLIGSDSHTAAAGSIGMLALGAGGIDVALALAGEPAYLRMPAVFGVRLTGELPQWVSAKDIILEMLRRHGLEGGQGRVIEYYGPALAQLSAMDRHVIANMGAELGATTTVFPSDERTREFLRSVGRESEWRAVAADPGADYDMYDEIDLSSLEPLIAKPSSPGNVVTVREVAGAEIYQSYIGSSANPGFRDLAIAATMVRNRQVHNRISFDINPSSRQTLQALIDAGHFSDLIRAGARTHQPGCNGCIGMGQAPAAGRISLRTVPRNFPGRSGTREDSVYLCSPETATASALTGVITDPRDLGLPYHPVAEPMHLPIKDMAFVAPTETLEARSVRLEKTPNISTLPSFDAFAPDVVAPVLLKIGSDISTDDIIPAGSRVMPYWSNIAKVSEFTFEGIDCHYASRAAQSRDRGCGHAIVAGANYGQGSSRENAAVALRYLGARVVIAQSFARIHWQNLINFGVLPLNFANPAHYHRLQLGDTIRIPDIQAALTASLQIVAIVGSASDRIPLRHALSHRQIEILMAGGAINARQQPSSTGQRVPMNSSPAQNSFTRRQD